MTEEEIAQFLTKHIEPWDEPPFKMFYRAAAHLKDSTYLPCVMFGNPYSYLELAIKRFSETISNAVQYKQVLRSFLISGGRISITDVDRVEPSPYAWPLKTLRTIHGETTMGWTVFTTVMSDGKLFTFATDFNFNFNFFNLPNGYSFNDIAEIHSGVIVTKDGIEKPFTYDLAAETTFFRDKPFFRCYSDYLPAKR